MFLLLSLGDTMKKMVEVYSKGNEYYYILDGKERGGFSTKEKAKADAKEMNRAKKDGGQKKIATGKMPKAKEDRFRQMGDTKLFKPGGKKMNIRKWWDEIIKKLTKKCHVCGHENPKDAKKCSNCGADISKGK